MVDELRHQFSGGPMAAAGQVGSQFSDGSMAEAGAAAFLGRCQDLPGLADAGAVIAGAFLGWCQDRPRSADPASLLWGEAEWTTALGP